MVQAPASSSVRTSSHRLNQDDCGGAPTEPPQVRRRIPSRVDAIMMCSTQTDYVTVLFVAKAAIVHVVQIDRPSAADDTSGGLVSLFPVFPEPLAFAGDPGRAIHVVGVPAAASPSAGRPGRSGSG